jgi:uncharacterized protein YjbI with pentapeptide repeats
MRANFSQHGYEILRELGRNLNGGRVTYLAESSDSSDKVVIKEFRFAQAGSSWNGYKAHEREIEALKRLDHPRIPKYIDAFETADGFCLVQEYIDARSLAETQEWQPREVKNIALAILEILVYLQSVTVFHRDIKPENILIDENSNIYLVDFGSAKINNGELSTIVSGTMGFMSPELLFGKELTKASDLYSLGATLICLLTNTSSENIKNLIDYNGKFQFTRKIYDLNTAFIYWLENLVKRDPSDRYPNARTALEELQPISVDKLTIPSPTRSVPNRDLNFQTPLLYLLLLGAVSIGGTTITAELNRQRIIQEQERIASEKQRIAQEQKRVATEKQRIAQEQERIASEKRKRSESLQKVLTTKNCIDCDLRGANLSNRNLRGIDLSNANLSGANLTSADLENANLKNANLETARLSSSNLKKVNLSGANLENANLTNANLEDTKLNFSSLKKADLSNANITKLAIATIIQAKFDKSTNFSGANLQGIKLSGNFEGINFKGANLAKANFEGVNFEGVNFEEANLVEVNFKGANLSGASLESSKLQGADLESAILKGANLEYANLKGANLKGANLENTTWNSETDLSDAILERANVENTLKNVSGYELDKFDFKRAKLNNTIMPNGEIKNPRKPENKEE